MQEKEQVEYLCPAQWQSYKLIEINVYEIDSRISLQNQLQNECILLKGWKDLQVAITSEFFMTPKKGDLSRSLNQNLLLIGQMILVAVVNGIMKEFLHRKLNLETFFGFDSNLGPSNY